MTADEYILAKSGRPLAQRDRDRCEAANYIMRHLKTEGAIVKTLHFENRLEKNERDDLKPFIRYSLNKKKRWEITGDEEWLKRLREDFEDVVLLERVSLLSPFLTYFNVSSFFRSFPIRSFHRLLSDDTYQQISTNSILGQSFENFLKAGDKKEKLKDVIAYHLISAPKNYETLLKNQFHPGSSHDRWWARTLTFERRHRKMDEMLLELRYGESEDVANDDEVEGADDIDVQKPSQQFYNLEDHVVDKFVVVKRRGRRKSSISCPISE